MGEKGCKRISRKVSKAGKDLATSNNKKMKSQAGSILSNHQHRYH